MFRRIRQRSVWSALRSFARWTPLTETSLESGRLRPDDHEGTSHRTEFPDLMPPAERLDRRRFGHLKSNYQSRCSLGLNLRRQYTRRWCFLVAQSSPPQTYRYQRKLDVSHIHIGSRSCKGRKATHVTSCLNRVEVSIGPRPHHLSPEPRTNTRQTLSPRTIVT